MPDTLLSLITRYAVSRTKHPERSMLDRFAEKPDNCINYILRTALPAEYCYDGLRYTFSRTDNNQEFQITCTFWYLVSGGQSLCAALRFDAEATNGQIRYRFSVVPESAYRTYDKMWAELYLLEGGDPSRFEWPEWIHGIISPDYLND